MGKDNLIELGRLHLFLKKIIFNKNESDLSPYSYKNAADGKVNEKKNCEEGRLLFCVSREHSKRAAENSVSRLQRWKLMELKRLYNISIERLKYLY